MALPIELTPGFGIPVVIAASVVLVAFGVDWIAPRPIAYIGAISYGLYLWHFPIIWVFGAAGLPLAVVLAMVSYRLFEVPLRRRLSGRVDRGRPVVGVEPVGAEAIALDGTGAA